MANERASRMSLQPGTRFGRYEVIAEIASGGMATVYLGRALGAAGFQRLVAIKLMHAQYAKDEDFVAMFMDEARLSSRIRHPNVVATLDLENDESDGLYLVMEYIEGDGMLSLLRAASKASKRIPAPVAMRIVLDMLNGLHAAHELTGDQGEPLKLVHRDVSPHNVLVGIDGISRITDFGIARAEERLGGTRDGQVKGKLAYMAPEQTSGNPVDRRADVFAVGVCLWESLTGKRLFAGGNDGEVLRNLLVNPIPRLKSAAPDMPDALEAVCHKALERDADARYGSAAQFADALEEAGGSIGIASARAVSQHVREVAGDKIAAMQKRARGAMSADAGTSAVRPVSRRRETTDPERTVRREEGDLVLEKQSDPNAVTGSKRMALPPPIVPKQQTVADLSFLAVEEEPAPKSRRTLTIALAGIGVLALAGAGFAAFSHHAPAPQATHAAPTQAAATPTPPTHAQPEPTVAPTPPGNGAPNVAAVAPTANAEPTEPVAPTQPENPGAPAQVAPAAHAAPTVANNRPVAHHPGGAAAHRPPGGAAHPAGHTPAGSGGGTFNPESM
jgi:serine/threonine-protein kinase